MNHLVGSEDVNISERSLTFVTDQSPLLVSPELLLVLLQVDLHHQGVLERLPANGALRITLLMFLVMLH